METNRTSAVWPTVCILIFALHSTALSKIIYVDDDATGPCDGSSWARAYRYLQDALGDAASAPESIEVRVAQGTYRPDYGKAHVSGDRTASFHVCHRGMVLGGFAGFRAKDPNARDLEAYRTVLTGDLQGNDMPLTLMGRSTSGDVGRSRHENSYNVVTLPTAAGPVILEGLTITGGQCVLSFGRHSTGYGGGLTCHNRHLIIRRCTFEFNFAASAGGALHAEEGQVHIEGCVFRHNGAFQGTGGSGGAVDIRNAQVVLSHSTFTANSAVSDGAFCAVACPQLHVSNCLFAGNLVYNRASAILCWDCPLVLRECTLSSPGPSPSLFLGGSAEFDESVDIVGCIFNRGARDLDRDSATVVKVSYSNLSRADVWDPCNTLIWGEDNMDVDPLFVRLGYWDPGSRPDDLRDDVWIDGDYHLKSQAGRWDAVGGGWIKDDVTSPCIDAGDPNSLIGTEPFPNGGRVNMGACGGTAEASKSYFGEPVCETVIAGDINGDCRVDFRDLQIMASHWLREQGE